MAASAQPLRWYWRYAIPLVTISVSMAIRILLSPLLRDEAPFLMLFPGVLLSGAFGGFGPGVLATVLGALGGSVLLAHGTIQFGLFGTAEIVRVVLFGIEGLLLSMLGARLQAARRRAEASERHTRRLERQILDISDAEQRRIGQDLHDGLGQQLTGVAFLSKALQQKLEARQCPESEDANRIALLVNESISHARALTKGLVPVALDAGLGIALSQLAITTSSVFGLDCACKCDDDVQEPDRDVAMHLFRIAQEGVSNAVKHARATRIQLSLSPCEAGVRLEVSDNGNGLSPNDGTRGMGLHIMDFRARIIGASLLVRGEPRTGTRITCIAPLRMEADRRI